MCTGLPVRRRMFSKRSIKRGSIMTLSQGSFLL
nr:MAG TPA: hypothetical protein [Caudoviricetes sp.]